MNIFVQTVIVYRLFWVDTDLDTEFSTYLSRSVAHTIILFEKLSGCNNIKCVAVSINYNCFIPK